MYRNSQILNLNRASQAGAFACLNGVLFGVIVTAWTVPITGLAAHELLGTSVLALLTMHVVFQWHRVTSSLRLLSRDAVSWRRRAAIAVNASLFVTAICVIYSGLAVSQVLLPAVGVAPSTTVTWIHIHQFSEHALMVLFGLHLAINWRWIAGTLRRSYRRDAATGGDSGTGRAGFSGAPMSAISEFARYVGRTCIVIGSIGFVMGSLQCAVWLLQRPNSKPIAVGVALEHVSLLGGLRAFALELLFIGGSAAVGRLIFRGL